jgi:hypothetical protein
MKIVTVLFWALVFLAIDAAAGWLYAQGCCDCPQTDTEMQCAMVCNAMIPRCRPEIPRPAPGNAGGNAPAVGMVRVCFPGHYVSGGSFCGTDLHPMPCPPRYIQPVCVWRRANN